MTSARARAYNRYPVRQRQLCWAHLRRDFQAMVVRGGAGAAVGESVLEHTAGLFGWWHWGRDGTWSRATWHRSMRGLRPSFRRELVAGTQRACTKTAATCREVLALEPAVWTFVRLPGLEPTNNAVERALRHPVQGRKTS